MIEFIKTKKTYIVALAVLFLFVSLSETTYSLFLKSDTTDEFNYNTGLLDLEFVTDEPIKLENAFPQKDSETINNKIYTLTIKNTGSLAYLFDLKMLSDETNDSIDYKYIKVKVNDFLPHTLYDNNNILDSNVIIYPKEEITYKISIWLDAGTPNNELGKVFNAKVVATGKSIYKTIDSSGANHPKMDNNMVPVYYDYSLNKWRVADKSNMNTGYTWYNYGESKWANAITIKDSEKQIYDLTGRNNIKVANLNVDNGNVIIDDTYLDLKIANYKYSEISNVIRIKFNDIKDNIYIISNDKVSYYYNPTNKTFIFKNGDNTVTSEAVNIDKNVWYIIGYTYDGSKVTFYVDGKKISTADITGNVTTAGSFKLGADSANNKTSKITIGDVLFYNRILSDNEFNNNYRTSLNIIYQNLIYGYSGFTPMTAQEYYLSSKPGTVVMEEDVDSQYVWIPRYKYRVWNVMGETNVDTYDAYHKGIDIAFETLDTSSGTIYCDETCYSDMAKTIVVTANDNGKYYTHPAFSTTTKELTGFWVSKYEMSEKYQSKAGEDVLRNEYLSTYFTNIRKINANYHVIKNTEWGAIVYLAHSKYGLCPSNLCTDVESNDKYISGNNSKDSTTGNIYGVFDLSGSAKEYTMANVSKTGSLDLGNSYFTDVPLGTDDYDLYQNNIFILGDATKETNSWYELSSSINQDQNWIVRNKLFEYTSSNDIQDDSITTRIIIK